jgi:hypothetical protein
MLGRQREIVADLASAIGAPVDRESDVVALWRFETSNAALRFLDQLLATRP